jgi:hypothetical protein
MNHAIWNDTPAAGGTPTERVMSEVPDGQYEGTVQDFSCFRSKAGDWFVSWWVAVDQGLFAGALLQRFLSMNERTVGFVKQDLKLVSGRIPSWPELGNDETGQTGPVRGEVLGARVRVRQKSRQYQGKRFVDVYLNELLEPPQSPQEVLEKPARVETRQKAPEASQRPQAPAPTEASAPTKEGWGDPDCVVCFGKGCDNCVAF